MLAAHDPREFVRGLQQILVSDSKKIGFLTGAGTSMIKSRTNGNSIVPGTAQMTSFIKAALDHLYRQQFIQIEAELTAASKLITLENIVSAISQKELVVGTEKLCGLDKNGLKEFREHIENHISTYVSVQNDPDFYNWNLAHYKFVQWVNDASRKHCVEIFTTNYDYLFEIAFERFAIPFFDGFVGSYKPFFFADAVEDNLSLPNWTKLWKVHGSLGWELDSTSGRIIKGDRNSTSIIIYPSILKYDKSKKQPFLSYLDRLGDFIKAEDSVLFVTGYSFGDDHINEEILNALNRSRTSSVIVFLFDDVDDQSPIVQLAKLQTRLSIYAKRKAVIGGKLGEWKLRSEPSDEETAILNGYFKRDVRDVVDPAGNVVGTEQVETGDYLLVDFTNLVDFLSELNFYAHTARNAY